MSVAILAITGPLSCTAHANSGKAAWTTRSRGQFTGFQFQNVANGVQSGRFQFPNVANNIKNRQGQESKNNKLKKQTPKQFPPHFTVGTPISPQDVDHEDFTPYVPYFQRGWREVAKVSKNDF